MAIEVFIGLTLLSVTLSLIALFKPGKEGPRGPMGPRGPIGPIGRKFEEKPETSESNSSSPEILRMIEEKKHLLEVIEEKDKHIITITIKMQELDEKCKLYERQFEEFKELLSK